MMVSGIIMNFGVRVFVDTLKRKFRPLRSERFFRLGHIYFDLVVFIISDCVRKTNFWCHILIDGLITKLHYCSPFVSEWSSVKCLGLTAGDSFSTHPLPFLAHPLPTSPQLFAHPRRATSLARIFACLFELGLEKERKRLLRRLLSTQILKPKFWYDMNAVIQK